MNVASLLAASGVRRPDRPAIVQAGRCDSYADLSHRASRLATLLRERGLQAGDRIVLVLPNGPAMVDLLWAGFWAGLVVVPLNRHLHPSEVAYVVGHCAASAVFCSASTVAAVAGIDAELVTVVTETADLLGTAVASAVQPVGPDSPAWLFYTSGTTGRPKGATLTHRNLLAMALNYYADIDQVGGDAVYLHAAPLSHGSGLYLVPAVGHQATNVISASPSFDPEEYLRLIDEHRVTHATFLAPTMLRRLVDEARARRWTSSTLRSIVVGGSALYESDLASAIDTLGPIVWQMYGQGESPMTISVMPPSRLTARTAADVNWRSCGLPFVGVEVMIAGAGSSPGGTGEICVRGDVVMSGYWQDAAATADTVRDGWLHTGDIGHLDERGFLYITDRSKDVIITGGSNVYPREVEEVLLSHPGIREAAVIGVPDTEWGESVRAFVVLTADGAADEVSVIQHCRAHLASFKKPREVIFVADLPKNANGKILKRTLREAETWTGTLLTRP